MPLARITTPYARPRSSASISDSSTLVESPEDLHLESAYKFHFYEGACTPDNAEYESQFYDSEGRVIVNGGKGIWPRVKRALDCNAAPREWDMDARFPGLLAYRLSKIAPHIEAKREREERHARYQTHRTEDRAERKAYEERELYLERVYLEKIGVQNSGMTNKGPSTREDVDFSKVRKALERRMEKRDSFDPCKEYGYGLH